MSQLSLDWDLSPAPLSEVHTSKPTSHFPALSASAGSRLSSRPFFCPTTASAFPAPTGTAGGSGMFSCQLWRGRWFSASAPVCASCRRLLLWGSRTPFCLPRSWGSAGLSTTRKPRPPPQRNLRVLPSLFLPKARGRARAAVSRFLRLHEASRGAAANSASLGRNGRQ